MQKLKRIIFVTYEPLTKKFEQDFYINRIQEEGYEIEYWDLQAVYSKTRVTCENTSAGFVKLITSFSQLELKIKENKNDTLFIFNINYYARVYRLFRIFSKYNCQTAFFARGAIPFPLLYESAVKKIFLRFKALKNFKYVKKVFLNQLSALARKVDLVKPFTYIFFAGSQGLTTIGYGRQYGLNRSRLIPVNSFDFDKYLLLRNKTGNEINERYCVFLDAYLPYHPDFDLINFPKVNATSYYNSLNNFFDQVEATYNLKIIIAAHPRSKYEDSAIYHGRTILKYKTAELIKECDFVLAHASTSVSFAVLFKKPIVFIYNNDIKKTYPYNLYPQVLHFAEVLKSACLNIDENPRMDFKVSGVDENSYNNYKYDYLTNSESENELTEKIFIDSLKKINA